VKEATMFAPVRSRRFVPALALLAGGFALGDPACAEDAPAAAAAAKRFEAAHATAKVLDASFAHVEYALRFEEGEGPLAVGSGQDMTDYSDYVTEERPLELAAVVLAPDRVLAPDVCLHPRFVTSVTVVHGGRRVAAKPIAYAAESDGVVLALEQPLANAVPVVFDASAKPPYRSVFHGKEEGSWWTTVDPSFSRVSLEDGKTATTGTYAPSILVDDKDRAVGVAMSDALRFEQAWKGSPLSWPLVPAAEHARLVGKTDETAKASLLRVHLRLRSPKESGEGGGRFRYFRDDDSEEEGETERDVLGVVVGERRVLVLHKMDPKTTSRLESIEVHPSTGDAVPARFVASYRHFCAFLVETEKPFASPVRLATAPVRSLRRRLLLVARVQVQGEKRVVHCGHGRFATFSEGWRRQVVPDVDHADQHFFFDRDGALVAFPVLRRPPEKVERWRRDDPIALPAEYLAPLLADPAAHSDPANVPVVEEKEGRLAWLGVELQGLDRDLARVNGVSAFTRDGETGALVSYVYRGSPAAAAGIEPGLVLLRVHAPERPKPVEIGGGDDSMSSFRSMFEGLGGEEEERFGEIMGGHPWPSVDNDLNRKLTEIGIGKKVTLEYAASGEVKRVEMTIAEGPVHFEAAPLFKTEPLGVTVRDLTYEVRRHYQLDGAPADGKPAEPIQGVIVSKIEKGGRAAVAGLRRFDVVLRVNDQPVADVATFEKAVAGEGEIRLGVKGKLKERVVKIGAAAPK
jgi:serine protease Do